MIYAIVLYWLVAGFAFWASAPEGTICRGPWQHEVVIVLFCLAFGGLAIPAKILMRALG